MTAQILDGAAKFGMDLQTFYRQPELVAAVARRGILIPPTSEVADDAPPALAYVNPLPDGTVRWIAQCPDCQARGRTAAGYVWMSQPLTFCMRCANRSIGGRWRRVTVPANRAEIEGLLMLRPDPETRAWIPGETVEQLQAENATLEIGGG